MGRRAGTEVNRAGRWWRAGVRAFVRGALAVYFRRIERFHFERVPAEGPVLFASNHPGSLTDAFIIGTSVPRPVHFVATVRLFRFAPLAALLARCGVVPINRRQDDPTAMRSVADTFDACFRVLEQGGAIGIFPEGRSYDDDQLKEIKTGTARMALEIESRHQGALGVRIVPVGLTYAAKDRYRSDVLVHVGEGMVVREWLARYQEHPREAVRELSAAIERRLRDLILDLPSLEHRRIVEAVKRLYLDRLRLGNLVVTEPVPPQAEELLLGQAIAQALAFFQAREPERLAAFARDLDRYERRLKMSGVSDRVIESLPDDGGPARSRGWLATIGMVVGAPVAVYGRLHRFAPLWFVDWLVDRYSPPGTSRAQFAHTAMTLGVVGFGVLYAVAAGIAWRLAGWPIALLYLASLPVSGLFSYRYFQWVRRDAGQWRGARALARMPVARRVLARQRAALLAQIEVFRADYRRDGLGADAGPSTSVSSSGADPRPGQ